MAFLPLRNLTAVLALSLAWVPACSDDPATSEDENPAEPGDEEPVDGEDGETPPRRDAGSKLDATVPTPRTDAGPARDGGTTPPVTTPGLDAGAARDAATPGTKDAATPPVTMPPAPGCSGPAAHGCYTPAANNPKGCPATSPEIPLGLPALNEWDLCNGGMVGAGASCVWNGPNGATANCLCDTGVHWICVYL